MHTIKIDNKLFLRDHYSNDPIMIIDNWTRLIITNCLFTNKNPIGHIIFKEPGTGPCIEIVNNE